MFIAILLVFALAASAYVLQEGLKVPLRQFPLLPQLGVCSEVSRPVP